MSWWAYKVIAVLAAIMSILVLWCEMAIPLPIDLSVFGLVVENAGTTFGKQVRRSQQPHTHAHTHAPSTILTQPCPGTTLWQSVLLHVVLYVHVPVHVPGPLPRQVV